MALQRLGGGLVVRHGEVADVLTSLAAELAAVGGIAQLLSHEETGTPAVVARNAAVAQWAQQSGVEWTELQQTGAPPAAMWICMLVQWCAAEVPGIPTCRRGAEPGQPGRLGEAVDGVHGAADAPCAMQAQVCERH